MPDPIITATGIHKTYDTGTVKVNALRGVDLTVERGEMVAIMGPSGCGKTTMLNCLSGLDEIDSGQVVIDGVVLHDLPDDERSDYRARWMGFVFQLYNLLPVLSAVENVELPLLVSGTKPAESRKRSMDLLEMVGLSDRAQHLPGELSGGQRQRVTIARAFLQSADLLLLDEATSALDTESESQIQEALDRLMKGKTSFVIAHRLSTIRNADVILVLENGQIVQRGTHNELISQPGAYHELHAAQTRI